MDLKSTYNKIAGNWEREHKNDSWWRGGVNKLINLLRPEDEILDVGCGSGTKALYLTEGGFRVMGIDFSEKMVELAKTKVPAGEFLVLDLKNLNQIKKEFDCVFAQAILLHFPKKEIPEIIQLLKHKVKNNGYIYIAVKSLKPGKKEDEQVLREKYGSYEYERFFSYFTLPELQNYLSEAGFETVYTLKVGGRSSGRNWLQIISRKL